VSDARRRLSAGIVGWVLVVLLAAPSAWADDASAAAAPAEREDAGASVATEAPADDTIDPELKARLEKGGEVAIDLLIIGLCAAAAPLLIGVVAGSTAYATAFDLGLGLNLVPLLLLATGVWAAFALPVGTVLTAAALRGVPLVMGVPAALVTPAGAAVGLLSGAVAAAGIAAASLVLLDGEADGQLTLPAAVALLGVATFVLPAALGVGGALGGAGGALAGYGTAYGIEFILEADSVGAATTGDE
jgi:hypothetical protein